MNNTNTRTWLVAVACAIALSPALQSQTINSQSGPKQAGSSAKAKKRTVKQLDGTKLFGFVEITDDYTIRITNDSGIVRLPIAQLGDADFRKYGFKKDRSKDGQFWYKRKEALKDTENPKSEKEAKAGQNPSRNSGWRKSQHFNLSSRHTKRALLPKTAKKRPRHASPKKLTLPPHHSGPCFLSRGLEVRFPKLCQA